MAQQDPSKNPDDLKRDEDSLASDPLEGPVADDLNLEIDLPEIDESMFDTGEDGSDDEPSTLAPSAAPAVLAGSDTPSGETASATTSPSVAPRRRRTVPILVAAALVMVVLPLGWLGWAFTQDRSELDGISAGLISARDAAEKTSGALEDGPERQQARDLASRISAIESAEWWDRVVVRIIAADDIRRLTAETSELNGLLSRRSANRAWWRERMAKLEEELTVHERTIAQLEAAKAELETPPLPHDSDGGVGQEAIAATQARVDAALTELMQLQSQAVTIFAEATQSSGAVDSLERLAALEAEIDAANPIDRRPPEIAQARQAAKRAIATARGVLERRDSVLNDLSEIQESAMALDREAAAASGVQDLADRLDAVVFEESDPRFRSCLQPRLAAQSAVDQARTELAARDTALAWVQSWMQTVEDAEDLEGLLAALQPLAGETPPSSELQVVRSAIVDLEARVRSRTEELVIEKAEREASLARAAACAARFEAFASALEANDLSGAASELSSAQPETEEQGKELATLKTAFSEVLRDWLSDALTNTGAIRETATQLRACLESESVARIAPEFAAQAAEVWPRVLAMEDGFLYDSLRPLTGAPAAEFEDAARWYLDPTRTRGVQPPMRAEIEAVLEAMKQPPVTLQVESIEWGAVPCEWSRPQTDLTVAIGDDVRVYRLGPVTPESASLLNMSEPFEQHFTLPRDTTLMLSVRGNFGCDDPSSRFRGSGEVTIDDLRTGGRFSLPFHNGGDDRTNPHKLVLVAFPDEEVRRALQLPPWSAAAKDSAD